MGTRRAWRQMMAVLAVLGAFFALLFYGDNKYQAPPPYGKSGAISLREEDFGRKDPIFLIDGWLLSDGKVRKKPTYIGEFSNLQRGDLLSSPHGRAYYQLDLCYEGEPKIVSVDFPQLSFQYAIFLDGVQLAEGSGNGQVTFLLEEGRHALAVETSSKLGYYSGMYFPPALGTAEAIRQLGDIQMLAYTLAFLLPLVLAAFTLFLWRSGGEVSRWFGLLCCCYAFYMSRYFVFLFSLPAAQYWFLAQGLGLYGLCFCAVQLTVLAGGAAGGRAWRRGRAALLAFPAVLLPLSLLIPALPWAVAAHGRLTDVYYMLVFGGTAYFALGKPWPQGWGSRFTLAGCAVFGEGLLVNLFFSNLFEPIRFFWQFEWCGLFLVLLFGAMMVSRSRHILRENDALTNHLEEQVKKRAQEVTQLLEERKAFFSDMAHDLKAPVFATQSFIKAIRKSGVGVDLELQGYLEQAEAKQWELARRLQGLSAINALDKMEGEWERVSVQGMLSEILAIYREEAKVQAVYFFVEPPEEDVFLKAQPEKLNLLFENLIYNALRVTPCNGSITISAKAVGGKICITVEDTGCGIPKEELPFVFQRFFVGENSKGVGTGLGLYIVNSIVAELGGTIRVQSAVGEGTKFTMELPEDTAGRA